MNNITRQRLRYVLTDLLTSAAGWTLFYVYRFHVTGHLDWPSLGDFMTSDVVLVNLIVSPFVWVGLYALSGYYARPLLKSHLEDLQTTFFSVLVGALAYFFAIVIDDVPLVDDAQFYILKLPHVESSAYVQILLTMLACVFVPVYAGRFVVTHVQHAAIQAGRIGLRTLVVGGGRAARSLLQELEAARRRDGYTVVGHVAEDAPDAELAAAVRQGGIEAFLAAPDRREPSAIYGLIYRLLPYGLPIRMRATDDEILSGSVRMGSLTSLPMVEYGATWLSPFRRGMKRLADVAVSATALVVLSPLLAALAVMVRRDSPGPVFYSQERIGRCGRPFRIYKFRSMRTDAEQEGPQLAAPTDSRITRLGHTLRKYRLDELPQFWNILRGDMSLVGPRPEREHYIRLIMAARPHYVRLLQVRPGLTSWGMVKYGYATTVDEMVERMRYDLMYIDNCTAVTDMKIIGYTIRTVLTGRGI